VSGRLEASLGVDVVDNEEASQLLMDIRLEQEATQKKFKLDD